MLQIRRYLPRDKDEVWHLHDTTMRQVGAHLGDGSWYDDLHNIEEVYLNNEGEFLVGLLDGQIVAMGAIRRNSSEQAEVTRMRIRLEHQRKGFGQQILTALEARARELGYRTLHLDTAVIQTAAQQLYIKNGFREVGRTVLAGFDVILFEKVLG